MEREDSMEHAVVPQVPTIVEPVDDRSLTPPPPAPVAMPEPIHHEPEQPVSQTIPEPVREPVEEPLPVPPVPVYAPAPQPETIYITRENPVNEELYAKYQSAKAEIDQLHAQIAVLAQQQQPPASELRRRTRKLSDADSAADSDVMTMIDEPPMQQEGVPLQVVVVIAVGVFVTTYLFF